MPQRPRGRPETGRAKRGVDGAFHRADHDVPAGTECRHVRHDEPGCGLAAADASAHGSHNTRAAVITC
jgi:hypothetical protein